MFSIFIYAYIYKFSCFCLGYETTVGVQQNATGKPEESLSGITILVISIMCIFLFFVHLIFRVNKSITSNYVCLVFFEI